MIETALAFLSQVDLWAALSVFWFMIALELPRYSLAFLSAGLAQAFGGRPRPVAAPWRRRPTISIIVAGHNEAEAMHKCLVSLREQTIRPNEIICVDDGSTDDMRVVLGRLRRANEIDAALTNELRCGKAAACNLAIRFAKGEIVINVDADCSYDRDAVEKIIEPLADPTVGAVSGNIAVRNASRSVVAAFQAIEYAISIGLGKRAADSIDLVSCASGAFSAFRRDALLQIGGVEPGPGEDLDLTMRLQRAGWQIRFAPEAWCFTDVPETVAALVRQRRRWDRDTIRLRLRKFRWQLNPFNSTFRVLRLLDQMDFVLLNLAVTLVFPAYLTWVFLVYGGLAWYILLAVSIVYVALDAVAFLIAMAVTERHRAMWLLAYVLGYGLFNAYVMRSVRFYAYFEEWVFRRSYRDSYVPQRVLDSAPRY